ncbi:MAG: Clp protease N-terminal domain-containing protein [Armatimonadota bacterium]
MELWRRCTNNLRQAILAAHDIAHTQGCAMIEPEHLALGLLDVAACSAVRVLTQLGVDLTSLRSALFDEATRYATDRSTPHDSMRMSRRARRALQLSYIEARRHQAHRGDRASGGARVATVHLLLGLTSPVAELGGAVLRTHGVFHGEIAQMIRQVTQAGRGA